MGKKYDDEPINVGKPSYSAYLKEAYGYKAISMLKASRGNTHGLQKLIREMPLEDDPDVHLLT